MMKQVLFRTIAALLFILSFANYSQAQDNKGTEFWFTMPAPSLTLAAELKLYFVGYYDTEITIEFPARQGGLASTTINLTGGVPMSWDIPASFVDQNFRYERAQQNGMKITSSSPIAVYAINYNAASSEIAPIPPVDMLGTEYYTIAYRELDHVDDDFNSRVQIVATEDNTNITIKIPEHTWTSKSNNQGISFPPDTTVNITLNEGETFTMLCNDNGMGLGETVGPATGTVGNNLGLNGVHITSDKKIAVIGGTDCTWIGLI